MTMQDPIRDARHGRGSARMARAGTLALVLGALSACGSGGGFDIDLRDRLGNAFDTSPAVGRAVAPRPAADDRGIISYPNYQVAVARRGDTVAQVAARIGLPADELARHNGMPADLTLRQGEIIALPRRVAEPSPATGAPTAGPIRPGAAGLAAPGTVATTSLEDRAQAAIARSGTTPAPTPAAAPAAPPAASGREPERHRVARGETAYSIARRYDVPVRALAEWNGLGTDLGVREGQFLLIPVAAPAPAAATETQPGQGTVAPPPPSAATPLPERNETQAPPETPEPAAMAAETTTASRADEARLIYPVTGSIIRAYAKGRNDGIDIKAPAGTEVKAADSGTVAAITRDTDQVPILVLRHSDNILTVYAGVTDVTVAKGDSVRRGQTVARIRPGNPPFLHFEVREGFDSVDPAGYLP
ncbi:M23 family metallopeptidase [Palleronia sediminis]